MPENKKQHYVPRCYLRRFSSSSERSINLHNLKSERTVLDANLNNQCYKNYLYGKELEYEKLLAQIEGCGNAALQYIDRTGRLPAPRSEMLGNLLAFVHFQRHRTTAAGKETNDFANQMYKHAFIDLAEVELADKGITRADLEKFTIGYDRPELASLSFAAHCLPVLCDLKLKLLRNDTPIEFITSDNPVVFYNPYSLKCKRKIGSATGLGSTGLQIYLPISPNLTLVYFDGAVYKVGGQKQESVSISGVCVDSLNRLQMLNANENVYFTNPPMAQIIERVAKTLNRERYAEKAGVRKTDIDPHSELLHWFKRDISVILPLKFLKYREKPGRDWDPRSVRDPRMIEFCKDLKQKAQDERRKAVQSGV